MALTIGSAIRQLRLAAGLSQRKLAKEIGVEHSFISLIEADRREPSLRVLRQVAQRTHAPPGLLLAIALSVDLPDEYQPLFESVLSGVLDLQRIVLADEHHARTDLS